MWTSSDYLLRSTRHSQWRKNLRIWLPHQRSVTLLSQLHTIHKSEFKKLQQSRLHLSTLYYLYQASKHKINKTMTDSSFDVPDHFVCPLTLQMMKDPLCSKYGHNFERSSILDWLDSNDTCPITRQPLSPSMLIPNHSLRLRINAWQSANEVDLLLSDEFDTSLEFIHPSSISLTQHIKGIVLHNEAEIQDIRRRAKEDSRRLKQLPVHRRH